jgi:hypothetical protein
MKPTSRDRHQTDYMKRAPKDVLETPSVRIHVSAGEVKEILSIEQWRLQKFLNSPQFGLSKSAELIGSGRGSRRVFDPEDMCRIGIAAQMVEDGFAAKFIGEVLEQMQDHKLVDFDEKGEFTHSLGLKRSPKPEGRVRLLRSNSAAIERARITGEFYYLLDIGPIAKKVTKGIAELYERRHSANVGGKD